jgi:hypothetical protein
MYEDSQQRMAKTEYADLIKTVSGALTRINKKSQHAIDQKMVLATHRVAATTNIGKCNRIYLRGLSSVTRSTPVTADELAHRAKFGEIAAAVAARRKDLTKIPQDNANFKAQKDEPNGKKTMRSYLWSLEKAAWEQANG